MSIHITTEKYVDSEGRKMVAVRKIKAMPYDLLPNVYLAGYPAVWSEDDDQRLIIQSLDTTAIVVNHAYPVGYFDEAMNIIRRAGERLHRINEIQYKKYKI